MEEKGRTASVMRLGGKKNRNTENWNKRKRNTVIGLSFGMINIMPRFKKITIMFLVLKRSE